MKLGMKLMSIFGTACITTLASLLAGLICQPLFADHGEPVAIRQWPDGGFSVETMWDLHAAVGLNDTTRRLLPRKPDAELESLPVMAGWTANLARRANKERPTLGETPEEPVPHQMSLVISKNYETKPHLDARPLSSATSIYADGLQIYFLDHDRVSMEDRLLKIKRATRLGPAFVAVATGEQFTAEFCAKYAAAYQPSLMIVNPSLEKIGEESVEKIAHNTVAAVAGKKSESDEFKARQTRFVSLGTQPYQMSKEVTKLFIKKEAASAASRKIFSELSVEQMNFKPSNGSHTPRWNTEHMMGRELLFFSQIYHGVDPAIKIMNLNPKQMPKDYKFAHPDWTGEEEARQMLRVENFTRRFAYLLDEMDLDTRPKGSRWTPRALLRQMDRHYAEHTANVVKKKQLEGWPKE